jgi:4-alpha-glucanotransferase
MSAAARLLDRRRSGVLLHPTSLISGEAGATRGALGAAGRAFIDWLAPAGFSIWQVLPLGPPGGGGSPYWARSDFAGDSAMIDRSELPDLNAERSDFEAFRSGAREWLEDYVLFEALAERFQAPWWSWPEQFRTREPGALAAFAAEAAEQLDHRRIEQWQFDWQWRALRRYAAARGVFMFGDLPIYVAPDSVATWSECVQFQLSADGRPAQVAGVPPDYFSADGQLWGNPLYDWSQAERDNFAFWRRRLARQLQRFDLVRIDHFRGLVGYWSIPAGAASAREGRWCAAPGRALFKALRAEFSYLPLVAEDLGVITPDVERLRTAFRLPGMRVLQFGFDGSADNPHLPHNYSCDLAAYTGTHDNDTTVGWFRGLASADAQRVEYYLRSDSAGLADGMIRAVLASVARLAIIPAQDLLQLGSQARFNTPGTVSGNWGWRLPGGSLTAALAAHFATMNHLFGRVSGVERA